LEQTSCALIRFVDCFCVGTKQVGEGAAWGGGCQKSTIGQQKNALGYQKYRKIAGFSA
jgi:hypothetical protein